MANSDHNERASNHDKNRRRALMVALAGAGVPLSQRVISGQWVAPVVDAVMLPVHAATSETVNTHPTGTFASTAISMRDTGSSVFENIAERSEEEILDLFVGAAEAADSCPVASCDTAGPVTVDVVATIDANPTTNACVQARVQLSSPASCSSTCLIFEFNSVVVNGQSVSIAESCELSLTGMTLSSVTGLSGNWTFQDDPNVNTSGTFSAPPGGGGCGDLTGSC